VFIYETPAKSVLLTDTDCDPPSPHELRRGKPTLLINRKNAEKCGNSREKAVDQITVTAAAHRDRRFGPSFPEKAGISGNTRE
jgi:hypothetical protein